MRLRFGFWRIHCGQVEKPRQINDFWPMGKQAPVKDLQPNKELWDDMVKAHKLKVTEITTS